MLKWLSKSLHESIPACINLDSIFAHGQPFNSPRPSRPIWNHLVRRAKFFDSLKWFCLIDCGGLHGQLCENQTVGRSFVDDGALGRSRTDNLLIRSQMLYPLSYERFTNGNPTCRNGNALPVTPMVPSHCADIDGMRRRRLAADRTVVLVW